MMNDDDFYVFQDSGKEHRKHTSGRVEHHQQPQQHSSNQSSSVQNLANVKSGAVAFFGAMSQDWFR